MNKKLIILALALFIIGCTTTTQQQCPKINCPVVKCPDVPIVDSKALVFVYFIDVGQGDAILIKSGETEMLIDCGKNSAGPIVTDFLKQKQVGDLEYLLITDTDSTNLGGCIDVLNKFNVHTIITNGEESDTISYKEVMDKIDTEQNIIADIGQKWNIGPAEIRIIQPSNGLSDSNENSIVSKFSYGTTDMLFTGNCKNLCEDLLLNKDIQSEILKVAYHGSKYASEVDFLEKVMPQIAIITIGENNYGHPAPETIDRLTQQGVSIYRTDIDGDITFRINPNSYEIIK